MSTKIINADKPPVSRLKYIDALRGIAVIMVIISHCHPYFAGVTNINIPKYLDICVINGDKGVTLFYVLSAYTLCYSLNKRHEAINNYTIKKFALRRFFRIAPLYYFAIICVLALRLMPVNVPSLLANIVFIHGFNPYWINATVPGGWSVGIEMIFYCLFPVIFSHVSTLPIAINTTAIAIIGGKIITAIMSRHVLISNELLWAVFTYENIFSQLPVFLIGICIFHLLNTVPKNGPYLSLSNKIALFILIALQFSIGGTIKIHYWFAIIFGAIICYLSFTKANFIVNRFTILIGNLSYSFYLIHLIISNILIKYHLIVYPNHQIAGIFIRFLAIFASTFLISLFTYNFIEVPFQKYCKQLILKLAV